MRIFSIWKRTFDFSRRHSRYLLSKQTCTMALSTSASCRQLIGVVQMTSVPDKEKNMKQATDLIQQAKDKGAQMVFLPECFDYVSESRQQAVESSEGIDGPIIAYYKDLAKKMGLWLSLGGFHERPANFDEEKRVFNTHLIIDKAGNIQGKYSKTHLFDLEIKDVIKLKETDFTIPGPAIKPPVLSPVGKIGMAICYDLRFPELSTALTQQGAEILTYPSAFTVTTGMAHWKVLLQNRAIENQCYVVAAAQVGQHHAKRSSYGHAMVVDPWGTVLAECQERPDVCVAEINLEYLNKRRREMPLWQHRRHDLYGHIQVHSAGCIESQVEYQFGQYKVPASCVIYKTALSIAFVNKKPVLPGHVLICPIRCVEHFVDMTPAEGADLFACTQTVTKVVQKYFGAPAATMAVQDGPEAGQTVKHVHMHVLPRKEGDFERNDDIYDKLEHHDKDVQASKWRSEEEMATEAAALRPLFKSLK